MILHFLIPGEDRGEFRPVPTHCGRTALRVMGVELTDETMGPDQEDPSDWPVAAIDKRFLKIRHGAFVFDKREYCLEYPPVPARICPACRKIVETELAFSILTG